MKKKDSSKEEEIKQESKEEVKQEDKEEESTRKRKAGYKEKMKVINSPCFLVKSWLVRDQTVLGKDKSNLLIADSLLKTIWFINAPCYDNEALASPNTNDPQFPDKVYKVEKALYGLHQAPRAWQNKGTPLETKQGLIKGYERSWIILKGQPKLGLWYPRDSPFDLEAFSDSDYAGASLDRKFITGEYVVAANCCGQNPVFHSKTKHIEIRHHFIRDCYKKKLIQVIKIHTDHNVADLLTKAFDSSRPINLVAYETIYKEWEDRMEKAATTASSLDAEAWTSGSGPRCQDTILRGADAQTRFETASKQSNDPSLLRDLVRKKKTEMFSGQQQKGMINGYCVNVSYSLSDTKKVIIKRLSIRSNLQLKDAGGTDCFANLLLSCGRMAKKWGAKTHCMGTNSVVLWPLQSYAWPKQKFNLSKYIFDAMKKLSRRKQKKTNTVPHPSNSTPDVPNEETVPTHSNDPLLSGEDRLKLTDLMDMCTKLSEIVLDLEHTKTTKAQEITNLKLRVIWRVKNEDASNQGKSIEDIDKDVEVSLVNETQRRSDDAQMFDMDALIGNEVFAKNDMIKKDQDVIPKEVSTAAPSTTAVPPPVITEVEITLAQTLAKLKSAKSKLRAEEKRRKPPTKAQKRNLMSTYLKNMGGYKYNQLKSKSYDEIQKLFDNEMKRVNTFIPMDSEVMKSKEGTEESSKRTEDELEFGKSIGKKRAGKEEKQESSKRQRMEDDKETNEHEEAEEDDEAEMKKHMEVVQDDEEISIDSIPLATKPPIIVEYKIVKKGQKGFYHLIRADGSSNRY
ncbi:hypothetical protein Tco_1408549 [Tanacetum coccineum]